MDRILEALVSIVVLIFSVVVHETAHGVAANYFGDTTAKEEGRITLNPIPHVDMVGTILVPLLLFVTKAGFLFGWAKPVPVNPARLRNPFVHNAYVAAAGPISNFILILFGMVLWVAVGLLFKHVPFLEANMENSLIFFNLLCGSLIIINCILGFFNLLPIPPLDGHWILFRFLPPRWGEALAAIRPYGFFILVILMMTGVIGRILIPLISSVYYYSFSLVRYLVVAL